MSARIDERHTDDTVPAVGITCGGKNAFPDPSASAAAPDDPASMCLDCTRPTTRGIIVRRWIGKPVTDVAPL